MSAEPIKVPGPFAGLSAKLITAVTLVILLVEAAVYVPMIANYRANWLDDRLRVGGVAVRVFDTVPDIMDLPAEITDPLLESAGALAIVYRREGQSDLIALEGMDMPESAHTADMRERNPLHLISGALETLVMGGDRVLRIVGSPPGSGEVTVEVLMPEAPLRADMLTYSRNLLILSLIIAGITALTILVLAERLLLGPIRTLTANVLAFRQAPESGTTTAPERGRKDELGILEGEMADMQAEIYSMLRQRRHLAELGMAVAKINHDLRNMLTSAQMLSDQVANLDDPKVHRLAPRLVTTLDKAIDFAQSVIDYGRQRDMPPRPQPVDLRALGQEAGLSAGVVGHPDVAFDNGVPDDLVVRLDPDQLSRVLVNLMKNAREALEANPGEAPPQISLRAVTEGEGVRLVVADNGPGLPPRARDNLFVAFEGSARAGGTGLGLAIARELTEANGGQISLLERETGTAFALDFPAEIVEQRPALETAGR